MTEQPIYIKATVCLILFLCIIVLLDIAKAFLIPFSIALLLTFLLYPISAKLEKWKFPRSLAIILSIILAFIVLGGVIYFISSQVMSFSEDAPALKEKVLQKLVDAQAFINEKFHVNEEKQISWIKQRSQVMMESSGAVLSNLFSFTGSLLASLGIIPIYIFFLTYYRDKFDGFLHKITKPEHHQHVMEIVGRTSKVTAKYLRGLLIDIAILSVLNSTGFLLLGINHAILFGVMAAILNIIPYIGVLIGGILPVVMALLTKDSLWYAAGAAGVCILVQFIDNNFITPNVVGSSVSINPLATIIVLIIGGMLWGVAGMMLFIPFLGMLKVVLDNIPAMQPYGYLIGEEKVMKPPVKFPSLKRFYSKTDN